MAADRFYKYGGKVVHVKMQAHRNTKDDELFEEAKDDENLYSYIEGEFQISFEGIHINEYDYSRSLNYLDHTEITNTVNKTINVKDFNGPYYSFGEPYAKKGSCLFEWRDES